MRPTRTDLGIAVLLAAAAAVPFAPALRAGFVNFDDPVYVTKTPEVTAGLSAAGVRWAFMTFHAANWHPLTWLSLQLDASLWGVQRPWGFHLTNVLLHAANAALLFLALRALTGAPLRSAVVAALFAVHPLRAESVAWVSERKDVLSAAFGLLALAAYAGYARSPSAGRYLAVAALFALSLLAKPMLVTLPFLLLVLDGWPLGRIESWGRLVAEKLPLCALAAASCAVTLVAQDRGGAVTSLEHLSFAERLQTAVVAYSTYLGMAVWPVGLAPYYPAPPDGWPAARVAVAALAVAGLTAVAAWQRRRRPYVLAGWLWYVGTLVPVIGIVQVGGQAYADRYTYLPLVGPAVALAWAGAELAGPVRRRAPLLAAAGAAMALLATLSWTQSGYWHDDLTLWPHTVAVTAPNASAHTSFGLALEKQPGRSSEAIDHYAEAVRIVPAYTTARVLLGLALEKQGRTEDAIRHYREALRTDPRMAEAHHNLGVALAKTGYAAEAVEHYRAALRLDHEMATSHRNLANLLESRGEVRKAIAHYREAARIDPDDGVAHGRLGLALARQGDLSEAAGHLERAAELLPGSAAVWFTLGTTREGLGRSGEAAECFRRAVALEPKNLRNRLRLAAGLARQGDDAAAEAEYREASRLNPRWPEQLCRDAWQLATGPDPHGRDGPLAVEMAESACRAVKAPPAAFLDALAAAYAEAGRFPDAAAAADRALAAADAAREPDLARAIAGRLALYRERRPFHESTADGPR